MSTMITGDLDMPAGDQLQTVVEMFLLNNTEMHTRAASHQRSLKHLFAEAGYRSGERMYPYMIFQVDGVKHVIVSAVNNDVIKVWCFKPYLYKAAMELVKFAQLDQEDIRQELSVLREENSYEWKYKAPKWDARRRVREMLGWADMIKEKRSRSMAESTAHVAKMVADAFYVRNPKTWRLSVIVTIMEPLGKVLHGEDSIDWNEGDFEYN